MKLCDCNERWHGNGLVYGCSVDICDNDAESEFAPGRMFKRKEMHVPEDETLHLI